MLLFFIFFAAFLQASPLTLKVQAESAILINPDNGRILYEKAPYALHYPASITKVATALWALKQKGSALDELITASGDSVATLAEEAKRRGNYSMPAWWLVPGSTHMGIKKGESLLFRDLLYGMMIASASDASNVIAEHVGGQGGVPEFMSGLNTYVQTLGCSRTQFKNPSGLFHPDQKTCAFDMALIMKEALRDPTFRSLIATLTYTRPQTAKQPSSTLVQTNRLLRPGPFFYPKAIGGKTGYLASAQNTLVVAAKDNDRTLIAVFLKTKERSDLWRDAIRLFEAAFNQPKVERVYLKAGPQKYQIHDPAFSAPLSTYTPHDAVLSYYPAEEPLVKGLIFSDSLAPPIAQGSKVGEIRLIDEKEQLLATVPLLAANDVSATFWHSFKHFFLSGSPLLAAFKILLAVLVILGTLAIFLLNNK